MNLERNRMQTEGTLEHQPFAPSNSRLNHLSHHQYIMKYIANLTWAPHDQAPTPNPEIFPTNEQNLKYNTFLYFKI